MRNRLVAGLALALTMSLGLTACADNPNDGITIGLITKQEENSYWVTMREVAESTASDEGVELLTATGESDVDVASQRAAFEDMINQGADGILIAPNNSTELNDLISDARADGVVVITLDTPVEPQDTADAYFGTDNYRAGVLIGQYATSRAADLGLAPEVAMLNLAPGISSGEERAEGFLEGFGIGVDEVTASADSQGDREMAADAMASILAETPEVNVIYTVNEEAALGALDAIEDQGVDPSELVLVTIDGSCAAMRDGVRPGVIDATAMQFPENMAREGILAIIDAAHGASAPSGFLDTGLQLVSDHPASGVDSRNVEFGIRNCWGD